MKELVTAYRMPFILIIVLLLALSALSVSSAATTPPPKQTVIIFPIAVTSGISVSQGQLLDQPARDLSLLISEGLSNSKRYAIVAFTPQLPSLRRAVHDLKITEKELKQQIDTTGAGAEKARMLARLAGANLAIIGSIDGYSIGQDGSAELTVTTQMLEVDTDTVSTITATGKSKPDANAQVQDEESRIISATYDVSQKILTDLASASAAESGETSTYVGKEPAHRSSKTKNLFTMMLGAIAVGFLVAH